MKYHVITLTNQLVRQKCCTIHNMKVKTKLYKVQIQKRIVRLNVRNLCILLCKSLPTNLHNGSLAACHGGMLPLKVKPRS